MFSCAYGAHGQRMFKMRVILACVISSLMVLMAYIAFLSYQHNESTRIVATKIARHIALTVIELGVRTFEPVDRYEFAASPASPLEVSRASDSIPPTEVQFPGLSFRDISYRVDASNGQSLFHFGIYPEQHASALRDYLQLDQFIQDTQVRFAQEQRDLWQRGSLSEETPDVYILAELTNFVSKLWDHRVPGTSVDVNYENFSTLRLAKRAKDGDAFYCQVFAMAVIEVSRALGYQGRLLSLSHEGVGYQHGVAEIWVPDLGKWVVFDADFNLFYGSPTEPLSATEVSETISLGHPPSIVHGRTPPNRLYTDNRANSVVRAYNNIEWAFRNDYWSNKYFRGHPNKSDSNSLIWVGNSTNSGLLTFKRTTSKPQFANFSVLSYAYTPTFFDQESGTLSGELAIHYPGARSVRVQHQAGEFIQPQGTKGSQHIRLPVESGENRYTITIDTDGYSTVRRSFYIVRTP